LHFVYIIYSNEYDQFYIGETENIEKRLEQHIEGSFSKGFTIKAKDWELFLLITCLDRVHARKIEKHIKKMKSKRYIRNLKRYPEMQTRLLNTFK
jgi:putative endonuclease